MSFHVGPGGGLPLIQALPETYARNSVELSCATGEPIQAWLNPPKNADKQLGLRSREKRKSIEVILSALVRSELRG